MAIRSNPVRTHIGCRQSCFVHNALTPAQPEQTGVQRLDLAFDSTDSERFLQGSGLIPLTTGGLFNHRSTKDTTDLAHNRPNKLYQTQIGRYTHQKPPFGHGSQHAAQIWGHATAKLPLWPELQGKYAEEEQNGKLNRGKNLRYATDQINLILNKQIGPHQTQIWMPDNKKSPLCPGT